MYLHVEGDTNLDFTAVAVVSSNHAVLGGTHLGTSLLHSQRQQVLHQYPAH